MRLLFLSFIPIIRYIGGMQKVTDGLIVELKKRGYEPSVLYYEKRNIPSDYVFSCPNLYLKTVNRSWDEILKEWGNVLETIKPDVIISLNHNEKALRFLKNTPDSIKRVTFNHLQPFPGLEYTRQTSKVMRPIQLKQRVLKWTGVMFPYLLTKYYVRHERNLISQIIACSDMYGVLTDGYKDRIARFYPEVPKEKLFSIPNPNPFWDDEYQVAPKENVLLFLGRLSNMPKNLISFARVWKYLEKKNPEWKALVVGKGSALQSVKNYCEQQQLKNIFFEGRHQDVASYYRRAKIVCVTSFFESWNMSIIEGMNYGCVPVAYHSYEATKELIKDHVNGLLVTPFDEKEMADKIQELIDNNQLMSTLSVNSIMKSKEYSLP